MTIWFVSRHRGAIEWARRQNLAVDRWVPHLDTIGISAGDTVIGTLPVNMAAEVCSKGATFLNLSLDLPHAWRGRELTLKELETAGVRLERFDVSESNR